VAIRDPADFRCNHCARREELCSHERTFAFSFRAPSRPAAAWFG
jgi:hypothetical protein